MGLRCLLFASRLWASSWHSRFVALDVAIGLVFGGPERRCLHDHIAGTRVVRTQQRRRVPEPTLYE